MNTTLKEDKNLCKNISSSATFRLLLAVRQVYLLVGLSPACIFPFQPLFSTNVNIQKSHEARMVTKTVRYGFTRVFENTTEQIILKMLCSRRFSQLINFRSLEMPSPPTSLPSRMFKCSTWSYLKNTLRNAFFY